MPRFWSKSGNTATICSTVRSMALPPVSRSRKYSASKLAISKSLAAAVAACGAIAPPTTRVTIAAAVSACRDRMRSGYPSIRSASLAQVVELRPDGLLGGEADAHIHLWVDGIRHLRHRRIRPQSLQRGTHLVEALVAVRDELLA